MHQLKYLSLRGTDIGEIPSKISMLEYLEVLDIREAKVRHLPPSVEWLKRMTHLLTGNKSKKMAVTLTEEMTKMTALETLSGVGISGSSGASMTGLFKASSSGTSKEVIQSLEKLTNLKKLSLYIIGMLGKENEESLLSAIEHLSSCSLKFLAIDDGFTGFLDNSFNSSKAPPEHLHTLKLSGMLPKVPQWIVRLHSLGKLTLSFMSLKTETLIVLAELHELFSLIFSVDAAKSNDPSVVKILYQNTLESGGEIIVPTGGFGKLKLLRLMAPVLPPLSFLGGAMPPLQRLELRFRISDGVHGLENLASLRQVFLTVSSKAPKAADEIKQLASKIGSPPTVIINEYNESSVEQPSK